MTGMLIVNKETGTTNYDRYLLPQSTIQPTVARFQWSASCYDQVSQLKTPLKYLD